MTQIFAHKRYIISTQPDKHAFGGSFVDVIFCVSASLRQRFLFKVESERKQFQAEMQAEAERSTAKAESMRLISNLDNEIANKKRLQAEVGRLSCCESSDILYSL